MSKGRKEEDEADDMKTTCAAKELAHDVASDSGDAAHTKQAEQLVEGAHPCLNSPCALCGIHNVLDRQEGDEIDREPRA